MNNAHQSTTNQRRIFNILRKCGRKNGPWEGELLTRVLCEVDEVPVDFRTQISYDQGVTASTQISSPSTCPPKDKSPKVQDGYYHHPMLQY